VSESGQEFYFSDDVTRMLHKEKGVCKKLPHRKRECKYTDKNVKVETNHEVQSERVGIDVTYLLEDKRKLSKRWK
jgi:hypothetical protein